MKKTILGAAMMIGFIAFSNAQNVASSKTETKKAPATHVAASQTAKKPATVQQPMATTTTTTKKMSTTPPAASAPAVKKEATPAKHHGTHKKSHTKKEGKPKKS